MANNLYDTGAPKRVIVVNNEPPQTAVERTTISGRDMDYMDRMMENLVEYLARHSERNQSRRRPPEATRARPTGPVIDAEFEVVPERRQLPPPETKRGKK